LERDLKDHLLAISCHGQSCQTLNQALEKTIQGRAEGGTITSLSLLTTLLLVQPKIQLALWVVRAHFWLLPIFSSTRIPTSSLAGLRLESINKCPLVTATGQSVSQKNFYLMAVQTEWDFEVIESFRSVAPFSEGCDMANCSSKKNRSSPFLLGVVVQIEEKKGIREE